MKIYLNEITDQDSELDFTQEETWVAHAVELADEQLEMEGMKNAFPPKRKARDARAHFNLRKVDDVVVVSGSVETEIHLFCSRCAKNFPLRCRPSFSALFCKDPVMAGVGHLQKEGKPGGQNKGYARHAHDFAADEEAETMVEGGKDLDITYLTHDFIDLAEILTEQLQLQIPFQPLCRNDCKGMCQQCGADLNVGRCACAKIVKETPFSVLKNLKLQGS